MREAGSQPDARRVGGGRARASPRLPHAKNASVRPWLYEWSLVIRVGNFALFWRLWAWVTSSQFWKTSPNPPSSICTHVVCVFLVGDTCLTWFEAASIANQMEDCEESNGTSDARSRTASI